MKKNNTLGTGAFARLCKTTKETLFHYDREGLLKPRYISGNGYRHYGVEQFFDFDMISMLKETGSTLQEIRAYMSNLDGGDFLTLLEAKLAVVKKERERLAQRERMLRDLAEGTREALAFTFDAFLLCEQSEERLEIVPTTAAMQGTTSEFVERVVEYIDFYDKLKRTPRAPFGMMIDREDVRAGRFLERWFISRATRSTPRTHLHVKAAGTYAVLAHRGTPHTHARAFDELLRHIGVAGLNVAGNAYVYDMMSHVLLGAGETYAAKYCVPVERPGTAAG